MSDDSHSGGYDICGAKTRSGGICAKPGSGRNGRCARHGGKSPAGIEASGFKTGRYSKALKELAGDISERVEDPSLLDPRRSIAVQEGVMAKLAELANEGDGPEFRDQVKRRLRDALGLIRGGEASEGLRQLTTLLGYVDRGANQTRALSGVLGAADSMNRSQARYWTLAMGAARSISPEEFIGLLFGIASIIEEESDKDAARRILARADKELCGGALGLGGEQAPPTSGS